jgi:hypothetical protein
MKREWSMVNRELFNCQFFIRSNKKADKNARPDCAKTKKAHEKISRAK